MSFLQPQHFPVRHYSSQDTNAPALSNADGAIKTILKACLITGYGEKDGAGWRMLDESDASMLVARPYQVDNQTNIRIDNGLVNGTPTHQVSTTQGNNLTAPLTQTEQMRALDPKFGNEWHCIVSDFAFVLCYQMGVSNYNGDRNHIMYVGSIAKLDVSSQDLLFISSEYGIKNGVVVNTDYNFLDSTSSYFRNLGANYKKNLLTIATQQGYAQHIFIGDYGVLPFFADLSGVVNSTQIDIKIMHDRRYLVYPNKCRSTSHARVLYIPLDYWEL